MKRIQRAVFTLVIALTPATGWAQSGSRGGVTISVGADRVSRFDDQSFGTVAAPGLGVEVRVLPGLGVGVDVHRATGLDVRPLECGPPVGVPCTGSGRDGVFDATTTSVTAAWYWAIDSRVQPYVVGGLSAVRSHSVNSLTIARTDGWTMSEKEETDRGFGPTIGVGVRLRLVDRFVMKPEWRLSSGTLRGRANLSVMRTSVAVGYAW